MEKDLTPEEYARIYDDVAGLKPEERAVAVVSTFLVELGDKGKEIGAAEILDAMVRVYVTIIIDDTKKLELRNKGNNTQIKATKYEHDDNPLLVALLKNDKHFMYPNQLSKILNTTEDVIKNLAKPLIDQKIIYQKNDPEKPYYAFTAEFKKKIGMK